jgi:tetraacyldisaccharide 4'-kinase
MHASEFRELVSGRRHGVWAVALRGILRCVAWFYAVVVQWRNRRYDRNPAMICHVDVPVVSVGNLTLGGTGKTPMVAWFVRWFTEHGIHAAVVSRGYGAKPGEANDEAMEMRLSLPDVPHLQNPDRIAAARLAMEKFDAKAIVLDDGFQHRRLGRDLDIVLLDALEPFGFGGVFPRGMLREPIEGLRRADVVVLSRADLLDAAGRAAVWETVRRYAPQAVEVEAAHTPRRLISISGESAALDSVRGQSVAAFCGIGNPDGFRRTLEGCGCRVVGFREFPDHHRYTPADLAELSAWAEKLGAPALLCTGKDLVKLSVTSPSPIPLWAVRIELEFLAGRESLELRLQKLLPSGYVGAS